MSDQKSTFYKCVVKEIKPYEEQDTKRWTGLSVTGFQIVPRVGDFFVLNDEEGQGQAYKVLEVHLAPMDGPSKHGAADIFVVKTGHFMERHDVIEQMAKDELPTPFAFA